MRLTSACTSISTNFSATLAILRSYSALSEIVLRPRKCKSPRNSRWMPAKPKRTILVCKEIAEHEPEVGGPLGEPAHEPRIPESSVSHKHYGAIPHAGQA